MYRVLINLDLQVPEDYFVNMEQADVLRHLQHLLENDWPKEISPSTYVRIPHRNDDGEIS